MLHFHFLPSKPVSNIQSQTSENLFPLFLLHVFSISKDVPLFSTPSLFTEAQALTLWLQFKF